MDPRAQSEGASPGRDAQPTDGTLLGGSEAVTGS